MSKDKRNKNNTDTIKLDSILETYLNGKKLNYRSNVILKDGVVACTYNATGTVCALKLIGAGTPGKKLKTYEEPTPLMSLAIYNNNLISIHSKAPASSEFIRINSISDTFTPVTIPLELQSVPILIPFTNGIVIVDDDKIHRYAFDWKNPAIFTTMTLHFTNTVKRVKRGLSEMVDGKLLLVSQDSFCLWDLVSGSELFKGTTESSNSYLLTYLSNTHLITARSSILNVMQIPINNGACKTPSPSVESTKQLNLTSIPTALCVVGNVLVVGFISGKLAFYDIDSLQKLDEVRAKLAKKNATDNFIQQLESRVTCLRVVGDALFASFETGEVSAYRLQSGRATVSGSGGSSVSSSSDDSEAERVKQIKTFVAPSDRHSASTLSVYKKTMFVLLRDNTASVTPSSTTVIPHTLVAVNVSSYAKKKLFNATFSGMLHYKTGMKIKKLTKTAFFVLRGHVLYQYETEKSKLSVASFVLTSSSSVHMIHFKKSFIEIRFSHDAILLVSTDTKDQKKWFSHLTHALQRVIDGNQQLEVSPEQLEFPKTQSLVEGYTAAILKSKPVAVKSISEQIANTTTNSGVTLKDKLCAVMNPFVTNIIGFTRSYSFIQDRTPDTLASVLYSDKTNSGPGYEVTWKFFSKIAAELAAGMRYLHELRVNGVNDPFIHGKLSPHTILFLPCTGKPTSPSIKISLLDTELVHTEETNASLIVYSAPEVLSSSTVTEKVDVYSYAITLWEIIHKRKPFDNVGDKNRIKQDIISGGRPPLPITKTTKTTNTATATTTTIDSDTNIAPSLLLLLSQCWEQQSSQRPSFATIYNSVLPKIIAEILARDIAESSMHQTLSASGSVPEDNTRVYGREEEFISLISALRNVENGESVYVKLEGPSGVGKSSIIERFAKIPSTDFVYIGSCGSFARKVPFYVLRDAIGNRIARSMKRFPETASQVASKLSFHYDATSLAILFYIFPQLERVLGLKYEKQCIQGVKFERMVSVLIQFIKMLTKKDAAVILGIQDLQWADEQTLMVLDQISKERLNNLMVITSFDPSVATEKMLTKYSQCSAQVKSYAKVTIMPIAPLTEHAVTALVGEWIDKNVSGSNIESSMAQSLVKKLMQQTKGNPTQIFQYLSLTDVNQGSTSHVRTNSNPIEIPDKAGSSAVFENSLKGISKRGNSLLMLASFLTSEFSPATLSNLTSKIGIERSDSGIITITTSKPTTVAIDEVRSTLERCKKKGILRHGTKENSYNFSSQETGMKLYELFTKEQKEKVHHEIAQFCVTLLLRNNMKESSDESDIDMIEAAEHVDRSISLLKTLPEKVWGAEINVKAAQRILNELKASDIALPRLQSAMKLLGISISRDDPLWKSHHELMWDLHVSLLSCELFSGTPVYSPKIILALEGNANNDEKKLYLIYNKLFFLATKPTEFFSTLMEHAAVIGMHCLPKQDRLLQPEDMEQLKKKIEDKTGKTIYQYVSSRKRKKGNLSEKIKITTQVFSLACMLTSFHGGIELKWVCLEYIYFLINHPEAYLHPSLLIGLAAWMQMEQNTVEKNLYTEFLIKYYRKVEKRGEDFWLDAKAFVLSQLISRALSVLPVDSIMEEFMPELLALSVESPLKKMIAESTNGLLHFLFYPHTVDELALGGMSQESVELFNEYYPVQSVINDVMLNYKTGFNPAPITKFMETMPSPTLLANTIPTILWNYLIWDKADFDVIAVAENSCLKQFLGTVEELISWVPLSIIYYREAFRAESAKKKAMYYEKARTLRQVLVNWENGGSNIPVAFELTGAFDSIVSLQLSKLGLLPSPSFSSSASLPSFTSSSSFTSSLPSPTSLSSQSPSSSPSLPPVITPSPSSNSVTTHIIIPSSNSFTTSYTSSSASSSTSTLQFRTAEQITHEEIYKMLGNFTLAIDKNKKAKDPKKIALTNEMAAEFCAYYKLHTLEKAFRKEAATWYYTWGATAKAQSMYTEADSLPLGNANSAVFSEFSMKFIGNFSRYVSKEFTKIPIESIQRYPVLSEGVSMLLRLTSSVWDNSESELADDKSGTESSSELENWAFRGKSSEIMISDLLQKIASQYSAVVKTPPLIVICAPHCPKSFVSNMEQVMMAVIAMLVAFADDKENIILHLGFDKSNEPSVIFTISDTLISEHSIIQSPIQSPTQSHSQSSAQSPLQSTKSHRAATPRGTHHHLHTNTNSNNISNNSNNSSNSSLSRAPSIVTTSESGSVDDRDGSTRPAGISQAINFIESLPMGYCHRDITYFREKSSERIQIRIPTEDVWSTGHHIVALALDKDTSNSTSSIMSEAIIRQVHSFGIQHPSILNTNLKFPSHSGNSASDSKALYKYLVVDDSVGHSKLAHFKKSSPLTTIILVTRKTNTNHNTSTSNINTSSVSTEFYDHVIPFGQLFMLGTILLQ